MLKTYPKTQPKKSKRKKPQPKTQSKPVSITTRKSYWISLTLFTIVFASVFGYFVNMSLERIVMMLVTVLLLIGFAFHIRFKPSTATVNKRALFIFVGASVIGFSIWAVMVLSLNATELQTQIANTIGDDFFAITSLMICLILGAFIGDWIGEKRNHYFST
ncbi:MAG: hypothetical protein ABR909_09645 [Candidatus Bathyarchaeia archaeon]